MNSTPGRHAIITGAGSGLGRALAVRLARDGWRMALADIEPLGAEETRDLVREAGGYGQVETLDVTRPEQWQAMVARLRGQWPSLDLLINNAGVAACGDVGQLPLDEWRRVIDTNLWGAIYGCHHCVDWLAASPNRPHIVNVASVAGLIAAPAMGPYNTSKSALVSLSETLYAELHRRRGVGVTVVCPNFFLSNMISRTYYPTEHHRHWAQKHWQSSKLTAERVAELVVAAVARRKFYVTPGAAAFHWRLKRFFPMFIANFLAKVYARPLPWRDGAAEEPSPAMPTLDVSAAASGSRE